MLQGGAVGLRVSLHSLIGLLNRFWIRLPEARQAGYTVVQGE